MRPQTRLDLLADEILGDVAPLVVSEATTAAEVDAVLRLRYECVIEMGWAQPDDHPDGRERDEYDAGAVFVVCHEDGELVGATRLVPPSPGRPLLVEEEFGVTVEGVERTVEAGRVVVPRRHRVGKSHRIMSGLFARSWLVARELGCDRVVGQVTPQLGELYRGVGLDLAVLGPGRTYFGEERLPIQVSGAAPVAARTSPP